MKLFAKKKSKINYLELTPVTLYDYEEAGEGLINVLVPRFNDRVLGKYLQPKLKNKYIRANLDEFGTATWLFMDGKNNVSRIGELLIEKFGEDIQPVNDRVTQFLTNLYNNKFISFNEFKKG